MTPNPATSATSATTEGAVDDGGRDGEAGGNAGDTASGELGETADVLAIPARKRTFLFTEMLVFAILSLIASWVLSVEAITLAADPNAVLSCSVNAWIDCAKVGSTWQANIFGFPNAFLGMISEPVVMTIAVASLARVRFPRWFMCTANVCYFLGVVFAYWLLWQSTYVIGALCPWCLLITLSTTFVFTSMTQWNILEGNLFLPEGLAQKARAFVLKGWFTVGLIGWLAIIFIIEFLKWGHRLF